MSAYVYKVGPKSLQHKFLQHQNGNTDVIPHDVVIRCMRWVEKKEISPNELVEKVANLEIYLKFEDMVWRFLGESNSIWGFFEILEFYVSHTKKLMYKGWTKTTVNSLHMAAQCALSSNNYYENEVFAVVTLFFWRSDIM